MLVILPVEVVDKGVFCIFFVFGVGPLRKVVKNDPHEVNQNRRDKNEPDQRIDLANLPDVRDSNAASVAQVLAFHERLELRLVVKLKDFRKSRQTHEFQQHRHLVVVVQQDQLEGNGRKDVEKYLPGLRIVDQDPLVRLNQVSVNVSELPAATEEDVNQEHYEDDPVHGFVPLALWLLEHDEEPAREAGVNDEEHNYWVENPEQKSVWRQQKVLLAFLGLFDLLLVVELSRLLVGLLPHEFHFLVNFKVS